MATTADTAGGGNQVVGKVFILYGTVKAVSPDGTVRILAPNSPIYANEQIITGADGSISIQFDGPPVTQLDLGRMTEIVIDEDVYGGVAPEVVTEAAADAEKIQEALLAGDEEIDLEATAAGGTAGAGGGHPVVIFDLDGNEVTPGSGAETEGIITSSVDPLSGVVPEGTAPPTPEIMPEPEPEPEPVIPPPEPLFAAVAAAPTPPETPPYTPPDTPEEPEPVTGKVTLTATVEEIPSPPPEPLPHDISHVLFLVETNDGTVAVKIDYPDSIGTTDPSHPEGYIAWIESEYEGTVSDYYIKAGSESSGGGKNDKGKDGGSDKEPGGFFDSDGNNITDAVQDPDDGEYDNLHQYLTPNEQSFGGDDVENAVNPDWEDPGTAIDSYDVTITATLDTAPTEDLTLNLVDDDGNYHEIKILTGETEGSVTFNVAPDELADDSYLNISIEDYDPDADGGGYDELDTSSTVMIGGPGDDTLTGGEGDDFILGGEGADVIDGGAGDDTIDGDAGEDTIFGGAGDDKIEAKDGEADTIGEGANDTISYDDTGAPPLDTLVPDPEDSLPT